MINLKKQFFVAIFLTASIACFAQEKSTAYKIGYSLGQIVGIALIALLVFFIVRKIRSK